MRDDFKERRGVARRFRWGFLLLSLSIVASNLWVATLAMPVEVRDSEAMCTGKGSVWLASAVMVLASCVLLWRPTLWFARRWWRRGAIGAWIALCGYGVYRASNTAINWRFWFGPRHFPRGTRPSPIWDWYYGAGALLAAVALVLGTALWIRFGRDGRLGLWRWWAPVVTCAWIVLWIDLVGNLYLDIGLPLGYSVVTKARIAVDLLGAATLFFVSRRAPVFFRPRVRPGHCSACGYDLRGLEPSAACPECGAGGDAAAGGRRR